MLRLELPLVVWVCCIQHSICWRRGWAKWTGATCTVGSCSDDRNAQCEGQMCVCSDAQCTVADINEMGTPGIIDTLDQGNGRCITPPRNCDALEVRATMIELHGQNQDAGDEDEIYIALSSQSCQGCRLDVLTRRTTLSSGQSKEVTGGGRWIQVPVATPFKMTVWENDFAHPDSSVQFVMQENILRDLHDSLNDTSFIYIDAVVTIEQFGLNEIVRNAGETMVQLDGLTGGVLCLSPTSALEAAALVATAGNSRNARRAVEHAQTATDHASTADDWTNDGQFMEALTYCPLTEVGGILSSGAQDPTDRSLAFYKVTLQFGKAGSNQRVDPVPIPYNLDIDSFLEDHDFIFGTTGSYANNFEPDDSGCQAAMTFFGWFWKGRIFFTASTIILVAADHRVVSLF